MQPDDQCKKLDIVILNKTKKETTITNVAILEDTQVAEKEVEKLEKHQLLNVHTYMTSFYLKFPE